MRLKDLIRELNGRIDVRGSFPDLEISDIACDSKKVKPGSLFVAVRGFHSDGRRFIPQALERGAAAVVVEKGSSDYSTKTPVIQVADSRTALALFSAAFFGHPSRRLRLIGVTGTNGKTTTTYLIKSIIEAAGQKCGLIGTIDYRIGEKVYPAPNTTPESLDLQRLLREMEDAGAGCCAMEVSSHALALERTAGCEFAAAAFTNLTQDHLDFHRDMESYFKAKLRLFTGLGSDKAAVVNRDDARAEEVIRAAKARVITFGMSDNADIHPSGKISHGISGLSFRVATISGALDVRSPLVGRHNIYNILTAVGLAAGLGIGGDAITAGISGMRAVPGRMEKVEAGQPFSVLVDYAHTEDALVRLLEAVNELAHKRIITVFGCGGDRDRTKRPRMGSAAARGSDAVIITSDNPRTEDPLGIIGEIEAGMAESGIKAADESELLRDATGRTPYLVIPDRREAVEAAVRIARPGDVIVLAGKGHEDYQIIGDRKTHFDDRETAAGAIRKARENTA